MQTFLRFELGAMASNIMIVVRGWVLEHQRHRQFKKGMYARRQRRPNSRGGYKNNGQFRYKAVCCQGRRGLCYKRRGCSEDMYGADKVGACGSRG